LLCRSLAAAQQAGLMAEWLLGWLMLGFIYLFIH